MIKIKDAVFKCFVVIGIMIITSLLIIPASMIINNVKFSVMQNSMNKMNMPEGVMKVESKGTLGNFVGNSNKMEFLNTILIQSDLPYEELKSWIDEKYSEYELIKLSENYFKVGCGTVEYVTEINADNYYVIYRLQRYDGFFAEFDIRAH